MSQPHDRSQSDRRSTPASWTIDTVLSWVAEDFRTREIPTPRLEAELLLTHVLRCSRIELIVDRDRPLTEVELATYRGLVQRRRRFEPVAYLRGEREFYGHLFRVDENVLIPRPDTETLVDVALRRTHEKSMHGRLLDLCTGSGNVAISFAKLRPTWRIDAVDVSAGAVRVARENAERLGAVWPLQVIVGDLYSPVSGRRYDLITANPPYIPSRGIDELPPDIREHEPRMALDGGEDGLDVTRRIVERAPEFLLERACLALEIGFDQAEQTAAIMAPRFDNVSVDKDLGGRHRVVSGVLR